MKINVSKEQILEWREQGKKWKEIAALCNCTRQGLYAYLKAEKHVSKNQELINQLGIDKPVFLSDFTDNKISSFRVLLNKAQKLENSLYVSRIIVREGKKGLWVCRIK